VAFFSSLAGSAAARKGLGSAAVFPHHARRQSVEDLLPFHGFCVSSLGAEQAAEKVGQAPCSMSMRCKGWQGCPCLRSTGQGRAVRLGLKIHGMTDRCSQHRGKPCFRSNSVLERTLLLAWRTASSPAAILSRFLVRLGFATGLADSRVRSGVFIVVSMNGIERLAISRSFSDSEPFREFLGLVGDRWLSSRNSPV